MSNDNEAYLASTPTLVPDRSKEDFAPIVYVSNVSFKFKYQASIVTGWNVAIAPTVAISLPPFNWETSVVLLYNFVEFKEASVEVFKLVWLKYAPAKVTFSIVERAKIPVPVCSFPSESIAVVHGVVKPCLPTLTVVFFKPV